MAGSSTRNWTSDAQMRAGYSLDYRPDIDGLRAVAIASVIAYHAAPGSITGGFVGVDVFFVISGYLISSIILREKDQGRFSLVDFYARRVRRLFPALLVVLASVWIVGWALLVPSEFRALGKHVLAGAAYVINFVLAREVGYFDPWAEAKPLLHLWSLAVEEQFYIVWPVVLLLCRSPRAALLAIGLITLGSLIANVATLALSASHGNHSRIAFFLPHTRFWQLSSGALLAWCTLYAPWRFSASNPGQVATNVRVRDLASVGGLATIAICVTLLDNTVLNPQLWSVLPCLGALLVIWAGPNAVANRVVLSRPLLVFVGLISYPLYLWHWPLLSFSHIAGLDGDWRVRAVAIGLSVVLACATYCWVERPIRQRRGAPVAAAMVGLSAAVATIGALSHWRQIAPRIPTPPGFEEAIGDWHFGVGAEAFRTRSGLRVHKLGSGNKAVLYVGDSNMQQYWPRIRHITAAAPGQGAAIFATQPGCAPIPGLAVDRSSMCRQYMAGVLELAHDPSVQGIVIAASWTRYFDNRSYRMDGDLDGALIPGSPAWHLAFQNLRQMVVELEAAGKWVWIILNIPHSDELAPARIIARTNGAVDRPHPLTLRSTFDRVWLPIREQLIAIVQSTSAGVVDPMDWLCTPTTCSGLTPGGEFIYTDGRHLRDSYARDHATFIDRTLAKPAVGIGR